MVQIAKCGLSVLEEHPEGIAFRDLVAEVMRRLPEANVNSVGTELAALPNELSSPVFRPSRGVMQLKAFANRDAVPPTSSTSKSQSRESDYYDKFAQWLKVEEEATDAIAMGGAGMRSKWGTPDVVGVYRPRKTDRIQYTTELLAAEIKVDPSEAITAFGQAVAYRLFATRSYVVVPNSIVPNDLKRLKSLAVLVGVGVVLFDLDPANPAFTSWVTPQRLAPDMFYVNEFVDRLDKDWINRAF